MGGTSISPAHLLLGFLSIKLLSTGNNLRKSIYGVALGGPGFWLLLTVIYAALSAYFLPRLFAGQTYVFPVRFTADAHSTPLEPATSNITQSVYLIGDFICFFVLYGLAATYSGRRTLRTAAIACVVLNLIFAALDLLTFATGTAEVLAFIRNATYGILNDHEVAGFKRIIGSFNEASVFGFVTLGLFAYTTKLWLLGVRPRLMLSLSSLSLCSLVFSTSTTAYVGFAALFVYFYLETLLRALYRPLTSRVIFFLIGLPILFSIAALILALNDDTSTYIKNLADTMIFNKLSTASGMERSSWNTQALQVFFDTNGFGAGNGSGHASC